MHVHMYVDCFVGIGWLQCTSYSYYNHIITNNGIESQRELEGMGGTAVCSCMGEGTKTADTCTEAVKQRCEGDSTLKSLKYKTIKLKGS